MTRTAAPIPRRRGRSPIKTFSSASSLAAAIEQAKTAAPSELWCFDPDRLARGNRTEVRHLGGPSFELLEAGVKVRIVSGDDDLKDPIRAVLRGERTTRTAQPSRRTPNADSRASRIVVEPA
jgi:hypothetical protein